MKSNATVMAALFAAIASTGAGASEMGISVFGCHTSSPAPGVPGQTIPGYTIPECGLLSYDEGKPGQICNPKIEVPSKKIDGFGGGGTSDVYCGKLSSSGGGATSVTDAQCQGGKHGVTVYRSGASSYSIEFTKNGSPMLPFPVSGGMPADGQGHDLCVGAPAAP